MISGREDKIGKNKIFSVLGMGLNVRWCDQGRKSCAQMRKSPSGERKHIPEGMNVHMVLRQREEADVTGV